MNMIIKKKELQIWLLCSFSHVSLCILTSRKKNLCVGCAHSLSIQRRASNKLKGKRRNCCLSLSLPSFLCGPATRLWLVTTTAFIYVITSPVWRSSARLQTGREQMVQWCLCVRVAIMDNKSLAAVLWRSPRFFWSRLNP
jgi:hypothetical protein